MRIESLQGKRCNLLDSAKTCEATPHFSSSDISPRGFPLVELSIVLVIIGLIIGGVVGGQALIKSARIQNLMQDIQVYERSFRTFEDQYDSFPGDMINASDYWPDSFSGNGDNEISDIGEDLYAWEHLSYAEVLPGG